MIPDFIDGPDDWARVATIVVAVLALVIGAVRLPAQCGKGLTRASLMMRAAIAGYLAVSIAVAWETVRLDAQPGTRAYLMLTANVWALIAVVLDAWDARKTKQSNRGRGKL